MVARGSDSGIDHPALHQRWLDDDGSLRDRDDAAAMKIADPDWTPPSVPRW